MKNNIFIIFILFISKIVCSQNIALENKLSDFYSNKGAKVIAKYAHPNTNLY